MTNGEFDDATAPGADLAAVDKRAGQEPLELGICEDAVDAGTWELGELRDEVTEALESIGDHDVVTEFAGGVLAQVPVVEFDKPLGQDLAVRCANFGVVVVTREATRSGETTGRVSSSSELPDHLLIAMGPGPGAVPYFSSGM